MAAGLAVQTNNESERGFSLIEVLVAFTILSLVMILSLQAASQAIRHLGQAGKISTMLRDGQSLLARVNAEPRIAVGQSQGSTPGGHFWHLDISAVPASPEPGWTGARAFAVEVSIAETEALEAPLRLSTIIVATPRR